MINNQRISIFNVIKWLTERYVELEKETLPNACKLIGIVEKNNKRLVKVQLAGLLNEIEINPEKIIENNLFEYFSTADKKKLFSIVHNNSLKISDQYFCYCSKKEMIVLTDKLSGNKKTLSVEMLSTNDDLISQLTSNDANRIGFLSGLEYSRKYLNHSEISDNASVI